jgi:Glycerophosphoryl diester phosphodiesterase family
MTWPFLVCLGLVLGACDQVIETTNPAFPNGGLLRSAERAPQSALDQLGAVVTTVNGSDLLGPDAVTKSTKGVLSLFYPIEDGYAVMEGGCLNGGERLVLEGYWRYGLTSRSGLIRFDVQPAELATRLCAGETLESRTELSLAGLYGDEDAVPSLPVSVKFKRDLIEYYGKFLVAGHHGACPNFSDCGASINSIETMRLMPGMGADVAEVDVRITKDGVPILYHDPSFTSSMAVGRYCLGKVTDFSMAAIRANCRLVHGEEVPTLEDALRAAVDETDLRGVWLDTKDANAVESSIALVKKYNAYAVEKGRRFLAVVGLPTELVTETWQASPDREGAPCLLEYDPKLVKPNGCSVWGPTWTAGPRTADVAYVQDEGLATIFWTVNGTDYINLFLSESLPNGFVTDRPGQVFYHYQMRGEVPKGGFPQ